MLTLKNIQLQFSQNIKSFNDCFNTQVMKWLTKPYILIFQINYKLIGCTAANFEVRKMFFTSKLVRNLPEIDWLSNQGALPSQNMYNAGKKYFLLRGNASGAY